MLSNEVVTKQCREFIDAIVTHLNLIPCLEGMKESTENLSETATRSQELLSTCVSRYRCLNLESTYNFMSCNNYSKELIYFEDNKHRLPCYINVIHHNSLFSVSVKTTFRKDKSKYRFLFDRSIDPNTVLRNTCRFDMKLLTIPLDGGASDARRTLAVISSGWGGMCCSGRIKWGQDPG